MGHVLVSLSPGAQDTSRDLSSLPHSLHTIQRGHDLQRYIKSPCFFPSPVLVSASPSMTLRFQRANNGSLYAPRASERRRWQRVWNISDGDR